MIINVLNVLGQVNVLNVKSQGISYQIAIYHVTSIYVVLVPELLQDVLPVLTPQEAMLPHVAALKDILRLALLNVKHAVISA